jgi:4'-phosphopantetheinyl transferase
MPLIKLEQDTTHALALWKIEESEQRLLNELHGMEEIPAAITYPQKRLEHVAGRVVAKELMALFNYSYEGIWKNEFGKPFLKNCPMHISLSHSFPYIAGVIDAKKIVGIDIEQVKQKLASIASRIFHADEIKNAGNNLTKLCIYWCAKEALIKLYGKKDLVLKEELFVEPFELKTTGSITAQINRKQHENSYTLQYLVEEDFVLVYNR